MAFLKRFISKLSNTRCFSLYPRLQLKEIQEVKDGNTLIIKGEFTESSRVPYIFDNNTKVQSQCCSLCQTGLDVKHTDVLILSQFMRSDGCMLPKRITGLCKTQQKKISILVAMAQKAGLMSNLTPTTSKKDPKKRKDWKKFNTYFFEETINLRPKKRSIHERDHKRFI